MSIVDPKDIHHRIYGPSILPPSTFPVVLLHGLMGFAANWGKIWPELQNRRPVLVVDQRGHGRSAKPKNGYTPTDYSRDLKALLDLLGWEKAHIVGHSMGGRVALRFCSLYPEKAISLTLEDSGVDAKPGRVKWIQDLLASIPTPFSSREDAKKFFAENFQDDPMTGSFLHMNLELKADGVWDWRFYPPAMIETIETGRATDATREFSKLQQPVLIVRGSNSKEFPIAEAKFMSEARDRIRLVTIEGAGHFVHAQKPLDFTKALAVFLEQVEHETFK